MQFSATFSSLCITLNSDPSYLPSKKIIFSSPLTCSPQNIIWVFPGIVWGALVFFIRNCCCCCCYWVSDMGGCCSHDVSVRGKVDSEMDDRDYDYENEIDVSYQQGGALVRLKGSSRFASMYSQQGQKGVNQDSMTVWEDYTGEKDVIFCGVFDGHGPLGHKVSQFIRDNLPPKLSAAIETSQQKTIKYYDANDAETNSNFDDAYDDNNHNMSLASWEGCFLKSFDEMDAYLAEEINTDSYCSGCTAVTLIKHGDQLIVGNLGDSRAVLCTRDKDQLIPVQLTVDLKPEIPSETSRIVNCEGRVFAAEEEPDVYRIWMPDDDCPGLAMSRAFGDFCLKDYGLIAVPDVFYRKITPQDEFVVLASDGVWDVLTNSEVINIVASAPRRSIAAKLLVKRAVRAWRYKYPGSKVDDCAAICLFLDSQSVLSHSQSSDKVKKSKNRSSKHLNRSKSTKNEDTETVDSKVGVEPDEEWRALGGFARNNSVSKLPRLAKSMSKRQPSSNYYSPS